MREINNTLIQLWMEQCLSRIIHKLSERGQGKYNTLAKITIVKIKENRENNGKTWVDATSVKTVSDDICPHRNKMLRRFGWRTYDQ